MSAPKYLTESEAWEAVADGYERGTYSTGLRGLCITVWILFSNHKVRYDTYIYMKRRIDCYRIKHGMGKDGFFWPRTKEFAPLRAALARQFAEESKPKNRRK